jgi:hypothetical protein
VLERILELAERADTAGRDPIPVTMYGAKPEDVESYAEVGVHRCVYWLPPRGPEATANRVEQLAEELGTA